MADELSGEGDVARVSIKIPQFSEATAIGWFSIIEAQFALSNVNNPTTKFYHAISGLPAEVIAKLSSAIHVEKDYDRLKEAILSLCERSKPELFEALLRKEEVIGRPSASLIVLQQTAKKIGCGEDFNRH